MNEETVKIKYSSVIAAFFKMGAISFGGGAALIPVIENELVGRRKWVGEPFFDKVVVVAGVSPASLPVSICAVWNARYSLFSAFAYALPGPFLFLSLLTAFTFIGETGMRYVSYASVGIISFVLMLLYVFVGRNYAWAARDGIKKRYIIVFAASFLLTCGGSVRRLAGLFINSANMPAPLFSLSMATLLAAALFIIIFIGKSESRVKLIAAVFFAAPFAVSCGRAGFFSEYRMYFGAVLLVAAAVSVAADSFKARAKKNGRAIERGPLKNLVLFLAAAALFTFAAFFISRDAGAFSFALKVVASSLTSFGGGEAYIGVADSVFVQTGYIAAEDYYGKIIGISSAMPGPVLVSIASGIGFAYGAGVGGTPFGWLFGSLGFAVSVSATAIGALAVYSFFGMFEGSARLKKIIVYIMPVVCGMLGSTALSLIFQAASVMTREGFWPAVSLAVVAAAFVSMLILRRVWRLGDPILLLSGGFGTFALLFLWSVR
ncbi:MAG: chromate transporter [Defluviitaleaceae bacterium]|nr:chromate transporter [Defluviitaleaceae bacterium]